MRAETPEGPKATASRETTERRLDLAAWRRVVTDDLLLFTLALCTIIIISAIIMAPREPRWWQQAPSFLLAYGLLLVLTLLRRRMDYRIRAWALLLVGYVAAVLLMATLGLLGNGVPFLVVLPALGLVVLGRRTGLVMAALSVLIYLGFTAAAATGIMADWLIIRENTLDWTQWLSQGLAAGLVLGGLLMLSAQLLRVQVTALAETRLITEDGETSREDLPTPLPGLDRYTLVLETTTEIMGQALGLRGSGECLQKAVDLFVGRLDLDYAAVYFVQREGGEVEPGLPSTARPRPGAMRAVAGPIAGRRRASDRPAGSADAPKIPERVAMAVERAADAREATGRAELVDAEGSAPGILLPLRTGGALLALLYLVGLPDQTTAPAVPWRAEEVAALEAMADQLAAVLDNARRLDEAEMRLGELSALQRQYTRETWQRFVKGRGEAAYHWLPLDSKAMDGRGQPGAAGVLAGGLSEDVWHTLFERVRAGGQPASLLHEASGQHVLAMPVRLRDVVIGVLGFCRPQEAGTWQQGEIAAIEVVASRMAFAADNLRLLEEAQRRASHEEALSQMTAHFARSFNMDTLLRAAVRELGRLPDVAEVAVYVGHAQGPVPEDGDEALQDR